MDIKEQDIDQSLLAYRITMLEKSTAKGFEKLENKLDMFTAQFVHTKTFDDFAKQNHNEHTSIDSEVGLLDQRIRKLDEKLEKHFLEVSDYPLVRKLVYGAVGLILVTVIGAIIALVII